MHVGELVDGSLEIAKLQMLGLIGLERRSVPLAQLDRIALACRAADVVDMLVLQDREEPGAQIRSALPKIGFREGTGERSLDQIVGIDQVALQRPRIARKAGNQGCDFAIKSSIDSSLFRLAIAVIGVGNWVVNVRFHCHAARCESSRLPMRARYSGSRVRRTSTQI